MLLDRIRFVTANFNQLQGLRLLPISLLVVWSGASSHGWFDWLPGRPVTGPSDLGNGWSLLAYLLAIVAAIAIEGRYRTQYGSVTQHDRSPRNARIALAVTVFLMCLVLDRFLEWRLLLAPLVMVVALGVVVKSDGAFRLHYIVPAGAWLGLSFAPLFGFERASLGLSYALVGGLTLLVCGIGDHLLLVRTMCPPGKRLDVAEPAEI